MAHAYPDHVLPGWQSEGYQYQSTQNTIVSTTFMSGRKRRRLTALSVPEQYTLTTKMTKEQLAIFEGWLHYTVKYIEPMSIAFATAKDCEAKTVVLTDNSFSKQLLSGAYYKITIVVEAESASLISESDLAAALS